VNIRKEAQKSQKAVASAAGISQSYYAGIETGARGKPLAVPVAQAIAKVLGFNWTRFYEDSSDGMAFMAQQRTQITGQQPQDRLTGVQTGA